jgi:hypothetical protein
MLELCRIIGGIPKGWPIKGSKPHEVVEHAAWEEAGVRERTIEWMSPVKAAARVDEPELKGLLVALAPLPAA